MQVEHLENHTARVTVPVEPERLEAAKQQAAKKLSRQVNIPGFRKGKAPYRILVGYIGEGPIVEEAVETLGNQVYREMLSEAEFEPYGPGQLEDVKVEETPQFTFVVPLQPTVDLSDYQSLRLDYTEPSVEDEAVDRAMQSLREQEAVVEESQRPAEVGNRLTMYLDARLLDDEDVAAAETEAETVEQVEAAEHDHDDGHHHHVDEKTVMHEHDAVLFLNEDSQPVPGFVDAMLGSKVGENREFVLTYPDDAEQYEDLAGKRVRFTVQVKKIENVTLPELTDDFAARVTASEEKPLSLLELRMRVRDDLQKAAERSAKAEYGRRVLDALVERASIHYPEQMVDDQVEQYLKDFDRDLRQRGLTLQDYLKIYNRTEDQLRAEYRDSAVRAIERGLVMREILERENIDVSNQQIESEIDRLVGQFGEQAEMYRSIFDTPYMRDSVKNDLLNQNVMDHIVAMARGETVARAEANAGDIESSNDSSTRLETETEQTDEAPEEKGESAS